METITLTLKSNGKNLKNVRIFTASVANNMKFDIEAVEDIKLSSAEAFSFHKKDSEVNIKYIINEQNLTIEFRGIRNDESYNTFKMRLIELWTDKCEIYDDRIILKKVKNEGY